MAGRLPKGSPPAYRLHKPSGRAIASIGGKRIYLGTFGSPESRERYRSLISQWQAGNLRDSMAALPCGADTVAVLCLRYLPHCQTHYVKNGKQTGEATNIKLALKSLRLHCGQMPAADFGPLALKEYRKHLISRGLSRTYINQCVSKVKRMFRWAVSEELIPATQLTALLAVPGLQKGRTEARETEAVKPVDDALVDATLPHLSPAAAALVQFMRLTGARPGEACALRPCDLDRSGEVWLYRPASHKTQHRDRQRIIPIGPRAQAVLTPLLGKPKEQVFRTESGKPYSHHTLSAAIRRAACVLAKSFRPRKKKLTDAYAEALANHNAAIAPYLWAPNQLRHAAGTAIRTAEGLEAAQVVLGHAKASVTEIYAERDLAKAIAVAAKMG